MKRSLVAFGVAGGLVVPCAFLLLGWALRRSGSGDPSALSLLHSVQLPLWPMSKLFLDDASGRHWLYLPLAAVLSNALIYCAIGVVAAWGTSRRWGGLAVTTGVALAALVSAWRGFGTSGTGLVIAGVLAFAGLLAHHLIVRAA